MPYWMKDTTDRWLRREWGLFALWLLLSTASGALPFYATGCLVTERETACWPFIHAGWAVSGGLVAGLIRILNYQVESQGVPPKIKRALQFEPLLATLVALAAYVFAQLGLFSLFRVGDPTAQSHAFFRVFALGLMAGLFWGAVLKRLGDWVRS